MTKHEQKGWGQPRLDTVSPLKQELARILSFAGPGGSGPFVLRKIGVGVE